MGTTQAFGSTTPRVLLVDDDVPLARVLSRSLTHLGLDVTHANCGRSAMRALDGADFDVVLLDLQMPDINGIDLLRDRQGSGLPATILHSAYVDVPTTVEAMQAGAYEVLQKPTSASELARRIHEITAHTRLTVAANENQSERLCAGCDRSNACHPCPLLIGESPAMSELRTSICRVAAFQDLPVLIEGPTGTGKELVARSIHALCAGDAPLVSVNCAAIPEALFESELFGHEAGAFTSAKGTRIGLLEEAGAGVLFLDEIGELPLPMQAKLLRVLETREFRRVGSTKSREFRARVVCASNRDLGALDAETFRSDLYFRIAGYTIRTPALADHAEDIPALAGHFIERFAERHSVLAAELTRGALLQLQAYDWPGNVRQLRLVVQNAMVMASGAQIHEHHLKQLLPRHDDTRPRIRERVESGSLRRSLPDLERDVICDAYEAAGQNLTRAAETLGIPRTTLRDRLRRYGLR